MRLWQISPARHRALAAFIAVGALVGFDACHGARSQPAAIGVSQANASFEGQPTRLFAESHVLARR